MTPSLKGKKIGALFTAHDLNEEQGLPMVGILGQIWTSWGAEFELIRGVPERVPEVDLLIPHMDLTVVSEDYQAILDQHPNVLNREVRDISKRKVSRNLVARDDPWRGPVIVKTNLNYGGIPEYLQAHYQGNSVADLNVQRPWRRVETLHPDDYEVFSSIQRVPSGVWRNEHLVVEKFRPEREGDQFCMHVTLALGDRDYSRRIFATEPVIKAANIVKVDRVETPAEIQQIREQFGLQFGKLDYVVIDGQVHLFDLNKTPGAPPDPHPENPNMQHLAHGVVEYL